MFCYYFFLVLPIISTGTLIISVSAISAEGIMHGAIANISYFPYQAAIFGAPDHYSISRLLCSGVIISSLWILSIAHCFMRTSDRIKNLIFSAIAGSENIPAGGGSLGTIVFIYTYNYNAYYYTNDLTMAKTEISLLLDIPRGTPFAIENYVQIPESRETFAGRRGRVAGYGRHKFGDENGETGLDTDYKLRYTRVEYSEERSCINDFHYMHSYDKFCGVAASMGERYTGMCDDDLGNPLVIHKKIVGLSISSHIDCDDTNRGSLYIEVSNYIQFISDVSTGMIRDSYKLHYPLQ